MENIKAVTAKSTFEKIVSHGRFIYREIDFQEAMFDIMT